MRMCKCFVCIMDDEMEGHLGVGQESVNRAHRPPTTWRTALLHSLVDMVLAAPASACAQAMAACDVAPEAGLRDHSVILPFCHHSTILPFP